MEVYTIEEIKKAFWKTYHESGEIWFDYLGTDEQNERSTQGGWEDFLENLTQINNTQQK
jgi:hypothetical protein